MARKVYTASIDPKVRAMASELEAISRASFSRLVEVLIVNEHRRQLGVSAPSAGPSAAGYAAAKAGQSIDLNPYEEFSDDWLAWRGGWEARCGEEVLKG